MADLVERYVHQVGRYLPQKERAEIEAELRSMIQDQLADRFEEAPSEADVAAVLAQLGDPRKIATSYSGERYLIGPQLYPHLMSVLRRGWLLVPSVVIFLNVASTLAAAEQMTLVELFIETLFLALQATFAFSAVVVLIFALMQHSGVELDEKREAFNPLELPEIDDPRSVDQLELAFGMAFGTFVSLIFLYFASVGGLTMRFNLSDPGEVIPAPVPWMILLVISGFAQLALHLIVLRRGQWNMGWLLAQAVLELVGLAGLYFALFQPLIGWIIAQAPNLTALPLFDRTAEIIAVVMGIAIVFGSGSKLIKLWGYNSRRARSTLVRR